MTERQLTTEFSKYLKLHPREDTEVYEFKMVKSKSFSFSSVKEHQIVGLQAALTGLWYKIMDSPYGGSNQRFTSKKPFDAVFIKARRAYVVPIFYEARKYKKAFLIPIKEFVKLEGKSIKMVELEKRNFESFYL